MLSATLYFGQSWVFKLYTQIGFGLCIISEAARAGHNGITCLNKWIVIYFAWPDRGLIVALSSYINLVVYI